MNIVEGSIDSLILRRLFENESIIIDACSGKHTMANPRKRGFSRGADNSWEEYDLCDQGPATPATPAYVYELVKSATLKEMFMSLRYNLDAMCVTEHQYISYAQKYSSLINCKGTFMLVKKDWDKPSMQLVDGIENFDNVFVAYIDSDLGGLGSDVFKFNFCFVWAGHGNYRFNYRVLVPQLAIQAL